MEWTKTLIMAIKYMENNLLNDFSADDVAEHVNMSSFYLQKGFKIMTGYTIAEYVRCRRLYLAAIDVIAGKEKVIDIAYRYGYETPESFTKAYSRFHGVSPIQMHGSATRIRTFLPLRINVSIKGGNDMDCVVEKMNGFTVIGFEKIVAYDNAYEMIPKFWKECAKKYLGPACKSEKPSNDIEQAVYDCNIGEFGVCIEDIDGYGKFRYLIAGTYHGGAVPDGLKVFEFPDMDWAKFRCVGPMPSSLQAVNTKIFKEWLPGNEEYKIAMGANIEWYSDGDNSVFNYESAIWVPVERI